MVVVKNEKNPIDNQTFQEYFSKFGEIKIVRPFKQETNKRIVEFWDSRDCIAAFEEAHGKEYDGGTLDVRIIWDGYFELDF